MELSVMNKALILAVVLRLLHPNKSKIGDKIIPPPIPINPEKKPI